MGGQAKLRVLLPGTPFFRNSQIDLIECHLHSFIHFISFHLIIYIFLDGLLTRYHVDLAVPGGVTLIKIKKEM